jgi:hypothetical protein
MERARHKRGDVRGRQGRRKDFNTTAIVMDYCETFDKADKINKHLRVPIAKSLSHSWTPKTAKHKYLRCMENAYVIYRAAGGKVSRKVCRIRASEALCAAGPWPGRADREERGTRTWQVAMQAHDNAPQAAELEGYVVRAVTRAHEEAPPQTKQATYEDSPRKSSGSRGAAARHRSLTHPRHASLYTPRAGCCAYDKCPSVPSRAAVQKSANNVHHYCPECTAAAPGARPMYLCNYNKGKQCHAAYHEERRVATPHLSVYNDTHHSCMFDECPARRVRGKKGATGEVNNRNRRIDTHYKCQECDTYYCNNNDRTCHVSVTHAVPFTLSG